jgi:hypothetical protein
MPAYFLRKNPIIFIYYRSYFPPASIFYLDEGETLAYISPAAIPFLELLIKIGSGAMCFHPGSCSLKSGADR